jgi:ssDNA-binding replication factor A large subunit
MGEKEIPKKNLYVSIQDLLTREEFDQKIQEEIKKAEGLIDEDTAALLVVDKLGRYKQPLKKIRDLIPREEASLFAYIIQRIEDEEFDNTNNVKYQISDDTGSCVLTLWGPEAEKIQNNNGIMEKNQIKIINGYVKEGFYGIEINIGKYGLLEINPENPPRFPIQKKVTSLTSTLSGIITLQGKIKKIEDTHPFIRENNKTGFVTRITLEDESGKATVILWGKRVKEIQKFYVGDSIIIENAYIKKGQINVAGPSKIKPKKKIYRGNSSVTRNE